MSKCPSEDGICDPVQNIKDNLFGKGPQGTGGVYGELQKKFSKWEGRAFFTLIIGILLFLISNLFAHEGRIAKNSENLRALVASDVDLRATMQETQTKILSALQKLDPEGEKP